MAARDGASSVQGQMIRITPLNTDGSIDTNKPVLTTKGFISASFSPEFSDGDEIEEKRADGGVCISFKAPDTLKRLNFSLSLCTPDPEAAGLLAGGKVICGPKMIPDPTDPTQAIPDPSGKTEIVGYSSPVVGAIAGNPVAIEIWSIANVKGKGAAGAQFWHWAFPFVLVRFDGDREFSNSALSNEFSGQALGNGALKSSGLNPSLPDLQDFVTYKEALENPFSYVRTNVLPKDTAVPPKDTFWAGGPNHDGTFKFDAGNSIGCSGVPVVPPVVAPVAPIDGRDAADDSSGAFVEPAIDGGDQLNADKLTGLGFIPATSDPFASGEYITIDGTGGSYAFHWDGTQWAEGVAP